MTTDVQAELRALRERVAELERRPSARAPQHHASRARPLSTRWYRRPLAPALLLALLLAIAPASLLADDRFGDVPAGNPHHDDIALIAEAGITRGCNPPGNTLYCPEDYVTRQQMASFLARTVGLGTNPPIANAKTAQTAQSAQTAVSAQTATNATNATSAQNAAQLGGQPASAYVRGGTSPTFTDLTVTGTINRAYTPGTASRATPIAFAYILFDGTMASGTPNLTAAYNATAKRYEIAIAGENYDARAYPTFVSLNAGSQRFAITGEGGGKLIVVVLDGNSNPTQADFQVVIFKP